MTSNSNRTKFSALAAGEGVTVDGADIVKADVLASNGVIHVIDTVLMPKPGDGM